ncbi:hypothetical protein IQ07DRAFT_82173 [Pyrenochaeta sp. DS3sAY3a]|nr:hypothetical protein IQ07DRAFT_82173 [Pyrenochaeta sp. DS3sAY3a]
MFSKFKSTVLHTDVEMQDGPTTPLQERPPANRMRRESQYRAVAHTMNKTVSGRYIRTWSAWLLVTISIHIAIYIAMTAQDLRKNLHVANSPLAKLNVFVVTFFTILLPILCGIFLRILAGALAGLLLGERGYSVHSASLLLAINLRSKLDLQQYTMLFRGTEKGIKSVLIVRLIGDYVTYLSVPFVALALLIRLEDNKCWMAYDWAWLLFALLWPTVWSLGVAGYMIKFWGSQECIRTAASPGLSSFLQTTLDMGLVLKDADGDASRLSGRWRYGHKVLRGESYLGVDQSFLGLVKEDECLSLTDMLVALEREDGTYSGKIVQQF